MCKELFSLFTLFLLIVEKDTRWASLVRNLVQR